MASIDLKDIESLIELFNDSDWDEIDIELDGLRLFLSNDPNARPSFGAAASDGIQITRAERPATAAPAETPTVVQVPDGMIAVRARNLGTFYRSPKPGAPPYVELGQVVDEDTEMCLIEVMKLFTALRSGAEGKVTGICVQDGDMVEGEQILFLLEPVD